MFPWNINIGFTGNGHGATLRSMFELAMASFHAGLVPAILFKQFDNFSNFHVPNSQILVLPSNA
jgi:hypothetical protein